MHKINVKIGTFEETYTPAITNAPKSYDGMGTIELRDLGAKSAADRTNRRLIIIPEKSWEWQANRNASGLFGTDVEEINDHMVKYIEKKMIERFIGTEQM